MIHISKRHFEPQPLFPLACCFVGASNQIKKGQVKPAPSLKPHKVFTNLFCGCFSRSHVFLLVFLHFFLHFLCFLHFLHFLLFSFCRSSLFYVSSCCGLPWAQLPLRWCKMRKPMLQRTILNASSLNPPS